MGLYERDYFMGLTESEQAEYDKVLLEETKQGLGNLKVNLYHKYPKAAKHYYHSVFPNHFLDVEDIRDNDNLAIMIEKFNDLIENPKTIEQDVLRFINENKYYPLIGSILKDYHFGHHGAYLFKEFPLGTSYKVDYLLIGDSSEGHHLVFVELESVNGKTSRKDGRFSVSVNSGINQVKDWKHWLESNYNSLKETFNKYKLDTKALPNELLEYNSNRIHYVVVSGRRKDYCQKTYEERLEYKRLNDINIMHYDNVIDLAKRLNSFDRNY